MKKLLVFLFCFAMYSVGIASTDTAKNGLEQIFGEKGAAQGDVVKFTFPRSDLRVKMGKVTVSPGLAMTSWAGFKIGEDRSVVMGDLVLTNSEVQPVIKKCGEMGIEVTALHNHLIGSSPNLMYLHYAGSGDPTALANAIKAVLKMTKTPMVKSAAKTEVMKSDELTKLEGIMGRKGQQKGNLIQFGVQRNDKITENDMEIPSALGTAMPINFEILGKIAATTGDFVLIADEVNPVIKALSANNIQITAIHNHMLKEAPRLFFLHFWGYDNPTTLAKGIKAALDHVNVK